MNAMTTTRRATERTTYRGVSIPDFIKANWYNGSGMGLTVGQVFARGVDSALKSVTAELDAQDDLFASSLLHTLFQPEQES